MFFRMFGSEVGWSDFVRQLFVPSRLSRQRLLGTRFASAAFGAAWGQVPARRDFVGSFPNLVPSGPRLRTPSEASLPLCICTVVSSRAF